MTNNLKEIIQLLESSLVSQLEEHESYYESIHSLVKERDFYFEKLHALENICLLYEENEVAKKIYDVIITDNLQ